MSISMITRKMTALVFLMEKMNAKKTELIPAILREKAEKNLLN